MNVLVLDSQTMHIESLARGLMIKGHGVYAASNGKKALDHLRDKELMIDLIITDHAMLIPDGKDLLSHLEENRGHPPVIMMTTANNSAKNLNPLEGVCGLFLEKPFSIEGLLAAMETCLQNSRSETLQYADADVTELSQ